MKKRQEISRGKSSVLIWVAMTIKLAGATTVSDIVTDSNWPPMGLNPSLGEHRALITLDHASVVSNASVIWADIKWRRRPLPAADKVEK